LIWSGLVSPLFESVLIIAIALFLLASYLAVDLIGTQPLAQTAVFLVILYRLMPRISGFNNGLARATQHSAALQRIGEILRRDDKEYLSSGTLAFTGLQDGIVFENVILHYDANERQVLQNLSLTIPRGRMVALVGESGAGKSSIISLLLRLYDPNSGRILVNGTDLRQFQLSSWQHHIGLVDQDPFLFNASVLDNIRFGHPDATREEVIQAAKVANAHGFIEELDAGYDTTIGDRGLRLSGGQRQRISIARAILRNPDLLIFDEATSDLDSQSEQLIQEAIQNLRKDRTVVVIAHRLSTVTMADSIIVLQKGQVAEQGTHAELLAQDKLYAQFWRIQSNAP
jgi:ATP-binding cassette subfamily B protein/subfamily B ATP-binding cassette protein MsbA